MEKAMHGISNLHINQFKYHAVSIVPRYSYIDNIGGDGWSTHHLDSDVSYRFDVNCAIKITSTRCNL